MSKLRFFRIISKNFTIKLISLILAILLWDNIQTSINRDLALKLPLEFKNLPVNYIVTDAPKTITVVFSSEGYIDANLTMSTKAVIDMKHISLGVNQIYISKSSIKAPAKLKIKKITPRMVKIRIDEKKVKTIPIKPVIVGAAAKGFFLSDYWTVPKTVRISGPAAELTKISYIRTEPVNISQMDETISKIVGLEVEDKPHIEIQLNKPVKIVLSVIEKQIEKTITETIEGYNKKIYTLEPAKVDISISGKYRIIKNITDKDIFVFVKIKSTRLRGKATVLYTAPKGVEVLSVSPSFVTFFRHKRTK